MSTRISSLLDQPEQNVVSLLNKLEAKNGFPSHDARFLAENIQKIRTKVKELGLDPDDTTGQELHHALMVKFQADCDKFDDNFGASNLDFEAKTDKATELIIKNVAVPERWVLKNSSAKTLLRQHPPKKVMKYLRYRSLESMLKRESIAEIFLGSRLLEPQTWHKAQNKLISKLKQTDFEPRGHELHKLNFSKWSDAPDPPTFVIVDDSVGTMALWPAEELKRAPFLSIVLLLLEELDKYGHIEPTKSLVKTGGLVMWWLDMDHLAANLSGEHVSMAIKDCMLNSLGARDYQERSLDSARSSFWKELLSRYEKLPEVDGLFDGTIREKIAQLKFAPPEPAYEFVEDF
jgi:hypothetical protein